MDIGGIMVDDEGSGKRWVGTIVEQSGCVYTIGLLYR